MRPAGNDKSYKGFKCAGCAGGSVVKSGIFHLVRAEGSC